MPSASNTLIGWPIYSDVGVSYTPTLSGGSWLAAMPKTNLQNPELYKLARSTTASPADTRFRIDLGVDRAVRVLGLVYRSPEHVGAPTVAARFRYLGAPAGMLFDYEAGDDASLITGYSFTRATTAMYMDSIGAVLSASSGVLRDAHFIDGVRTTLLEPATTNLLLRSEEFDNASWSKTNVTVTANAATAPDGTVTADKIEATTTAATALTQPATAGGSSFTYTIFIKQGSGVTDANRFAIRNNTTATDLLFVSVNYSTGAITYTTGSTGASMVFVPATGYWRLTLTVTSGVSAGNSIVCYAGFTSAPETAGEYFYGWGAQAESNAYATQYIKTTSATVTRNADVLSFTAPSTSGTIYQKYWDLATQAFVESTLAYSGGAAIPFTTGRAYVATRIATGTKTQAEMQALVYDSGWFSSFPSGKTAEDTEDMNLGAWKFTTADTTMRYVSVQIDDARNAAGYVDLHRLVVAAGIQPATNIVAGAKLGLGGGGETFENASGAVFVRRLPTWRTATVGYDEQFDSDALGLQFPMQRIAGTSRQMVFAWDPTDTTYLHHRTFLATLVKLSEFEANIGARWVIPYEFREVL